MLIVCKIAFTSTHQETLEKMKVYYLHDLEITQHSGALWRGERENPGFCFYRGQGFCGLTLYW